MANGSFSGKVAIVGVDPTPEAVRVGMPVEIVYTIATEEITLPMFRLR